MFSPFIFLLHSVILQTLSRGVCCKLLAQSQVGGLGSVIKLNFCFPVSCLFLYALHGLFLDGKKTVMLKQSHKEANKSDLKQQTQCSDRSALSRSSGNLTVYSATSTMHFLYSTRNRVDMQWLLNRHPGATGEPCKK